MRRNELARGMSLAMESGIPAARKAETMNKPLKHEIVGGEPATLAMVEAFAYRWHESEREAWDRNGYTAPHMAHDTYNVKTVKDRGRVWFAVDCGTSGHYLVRKADGQVFTIEGYGRPNYHYPQGHVSILCQGYGLRRPA